MKIKIRGASISVTTCFASPTNKPDSRHYNAGTTNVRITARWRVIPGRLTRISKGRAGVWGVNRHGHIYRLNRNGKYKTQHQDRNYKLFNPLVKQIQSNISAQHSI